MSITPEVLAALQATARDIGFHILKPLPRNAWNHYNAGYFTRNDPQPGRTEWYSLPKAGTVRCSLGDEGYIEFSNIRPTTLAGTEFDNPVVSNSTRVDAQISTISNNSVATIDREYAHSSSAERTLSQTVGVGFSIAIEQKFGYSVGVVQGETTITAEVSSSYERQWGNTESTSRSTITSVSVPPKTRLILSTAKEIADFTQKARVFTGVDYGITVKARNEWTSMYNSIDHFATVISGFGLDTDPHAAWFRDRPIGKQSATGILSIDPVLLEFEITGESAIVGEIVASSEQL